MTKSTEKTGATKTTKPASRKKIASPKTSATKTAAKAASRKTSTQKTAAKATSSKPTPKISAKKATTQKPAAKKSINPKSVSSKKTTSSTKSASQRVDKRANTDKETKSSKPHSKSKIQTATSSGETSTSKARIKATTNNTKTAPDKGNETVSSNTAVKTEKKATATTTRKPAKKAAKRATKPKPLFKTNDQVIYPAHGVGIIIDIEKQTIVGIDIELYVINFEHEKMKLRLPIDKTESSGIRPLSTNEEVDKILKVLEGRARIKRTMWSRRAQEYEAKINSGSLRLVAEVVRDLYRSAEQPEQSYSERQLYEAAVDRMAREVASVRRIDLPAAIIEMENWLHKKQIVLPAPPQALP